MSSAVIGNFILDSKSPFIWVDGSEFGDNSYKYWADGEPNFGSENTEYCAYINNKNGHWDDNKCQDQPHKLICKKNKDQAQGRKNMIYLYFYIL